MPLAAGAEFQFQSLSRDSARSGLHGEWLVERYDAFQSLSRDSARSGCIRCTTQIGELTFQSLSRDSARSGKPAATGWRFY